VQSLSKWKQSLLKLAAMLLQQSLFEEHSVSELLWGYELKLPPYVPKAFAPYIDEFIKIFNKNSSEFGIYVGVCYLCFIQLSMLMYSVNVYSIIFVNYLSGTTSCFGTLYIFCL